MVLNILKYWNNVFDINVCVLFILVDKNGILDFEFICEYVVNVLMICIMVVNNEIGVF